MPSTESTSPMRSAPPVPLTNTRLRYGRLAQAFHWTIAVLFLVNYPLALVAERLPRDTSAEVARVVELFSWHKTIGLTVFVLAVARIAWALANPHPRLLNAEKRGEAFAAATVHWVLYGAILAMPLAGMAVHWTSVGFAPLKLPFPDTVPCCHAPSTPPRSRPWCTGRSASSSSPPSRRTWRARSSTTSSIATRR